MNQSLFIISLNMVPSQIARQSWPNVESSSLIIWAQRCSRRCWPNVILLIGLTLDQHVLFHVGLTYNNNRYYVGPTWNQCILYLMTQGQRWPNLHRYMYLGFLPSSFHSNLTKISSTLSSFWLST